MVIDEAESEALAQHVAGGPLLATSSLAVVEVSRAARVASPASGLPDAVDELLDACMLVGVSDELLRSAVDFASSSVRTLDAVHVASAVRIGADEFLAYDRRLITAARACDLAVRSPGTAS